MPKQAFTNRISEILSVLRFGDLPSSLYEELDGVGSMSYCTQDRLMQLPNIAEVLGYRRWNISRTAVQTIEEIAPYTSVDSPDDSTINQSSRPDTLSLPVSSEVFNSKILLRSQSGVGKTGLVYRIVHGVIVRGTSFYAVSNVLLSQPVNPGHHEYSACELLASTGELIRQWPLLSMSLGGDYGREVLKELPFLKGEQDEKTFLSDSTLMLADETRIEARSLRVFEKFARIYQYVRRRRPGNKFGNLALWLDYRLGRIHKRNLARVLESPPSMFEDTLTLNSVNSVISFQRDSLSTSVMRRPYICLWRLSLELHSLHEWRNVLSRYIQLYTRRTSYSHRGDTYAISGARKRKYDRYCGLMVNLDVGNLSIFPSKPHHGRTKAIKWRFAKIRGTSSMKLIQLCRSLFSVGDARMRRDDDAMVFASSSLRIRYELRRLVLENLQFLMSQ